MPKTVDGYICPNGHGSLELAENNPDVYGHGLVEVIRNPNGTAYFNMSRAFVVKIYICRQCGYVELYDAPPIPLPDPE